MAGESFEADLAAVEGDLGQLVRRLRSLSPRSWQSRRPAVDATLAGLVALCASVENRPLTPPVVADHVLADAIAVIAGDALDAIAVAHDRPSLDSLASLLRDGLDSTR